MRMLREVLRLRFECGLSTAGIGKSCGISKTTVSNYLYRSIEAGLNWPLAAQLDDAELEGFLFPLAVDSLDSEFKSSDWALVHQELRKKGVTRMLLWHEYKAKRPDGLSYSRFCDTYQRFVGSLKLSMRQEHKAGEKLFVDYAGKTVPIYDAQTGDVREAQIFVAVWGASNYTYADASWSQDLSSWTCSHARAFEYFGCVPEIVVPDNLKSGVTSPCRYDPDINPTYAELAAHYKVAVIPARVLRPKDKAKVECGVLLVTRWILAALRHRKFFSIFSLNEAIRELLEKLNDKPFQKLPGSRKSVFETIDKPAAKVLPAFSYQYAEIRQARVNIDYHIAVDDHFYSVPYQLRSEKVTVRLSSDTLEILHKNRRIVTHTRSYQKWAYTTLHEHMPKAHQKHLEWTPSRLVSWAETMGPFTAEVVSEIMRSQTHPEIGFRGCLGIFRLGKRYGKNRIEDACKRAATFKLFRYKQVKSILERGLDREDLAQTQAIEVPPIHHANIRGGEYYEPIPIGEESNDGKRDDGKSK